MGWPVTQDFKNRIAATRRQVYGKVTIDYTDPFLDQSVGVAVNEQASVSYPDQTADGVETPFKKILSLDGSCSLDGTYALAPFDENDAYLHKMGWWGLQMAGVGGAFVLPYPTLTITHFLRPVHILKVVGDDKRGEYPVDFTVQLLDESDVVLHTENVVGNTSTNWSLVLISPVLDVAKQILTITKWSHEGRQAKIVEFFTSIQETYEGDDLFSINLVEEREVSRGSLPVGNISSNELEVVLANHTRKFDAGNTQSPLYRTLKANRRVRAWLGIDAENLGSERPASFTRSSTAYNPDTGELVEANVPRFVDGPWAGSKAMLVEGGTTNILSASASQGLSWAGYLGCVLTVTPNQPDPLNGDKGVHLLSSGGTDTIKAIISVGMPANRVKWAGQLWMRNRSSVEITVHTNLGGVAAVVSPHSEWIPVRWVLTGDGLGMAIIQLMLPTAEDILDCDVAFLQCEAKPYHTTWHLGGATRSNESLTIPTAKICTPDNFHLEFFAYIDSMARWQAVPLATLFHFPRSVVYVSNVGIWMYHSHTSAEWVLQTRKDDNASQATKCSDAYTPDGWHYFVVDMTPERASVRIDGIERIVRDNPYLPSGFAANGYLGSYHVGNSVFNGKLCCWRFSSRARTDEEILQAYQSNAPLSLDADTTYLLPLNTSIYPVERVWVPLGGFWSMDWTAPEDDIHASTLARDRLELLRKSQYSSSQVAIDATLKDLAEAILADAGLVPAEYWVDPELATFVVPYAWFESQSHREALRKIAEACLGQVYCDRNGVIRVEGPSYLAGAVVTDAPITGDDYFTKDNPVRWSQIANYVEVETSPLRPDVLQEVYRSNDPVAALAGQTKTITAFYNSSPCINAVASLESAPPDYAITEVTYYAWGATVKVSAGSDGSFVLVIQAQPLRTLNKDRAVAQDTVSIADNGLLAYSYPVNSLVQTLEAAQLIADTLLASFKEPRRDIDMDWRGDPTVLLRDKVTVTDLGEENDYFVIKQEINWDGGLTTKMSGRRAP